MKHNTHIYVASKAIEFLRDSINNLQTMTGHPSRANTRPLKAKAKRLQRLMVSHADTIIEASWAPDDILNDKSRFHTFKLYDKKVLHQPGTNDPQEPVPVPGTGTVPGTNKLYRGSGGGGLPYKVDHLAAVISDLSKLRSYNDNFTVRELTYLYILISHYVVDAHVPMHCDLRDDPPSPTNKTKPGPRSAYFPNSLHGQVESLWDRAVTPVAVAEKILVAETYKDHQKPNALSPHVTFNIHNKAHTKLIRPVLIPDGALMKFMISRCAQTYERSQQIWPPSVPATTYSTKNVTPKATTQILADSIAAVVSVWMSI